jgi:hypothetical protein
VGGEQRAKVSQEYLHVADIHGVTPASAASWARSSSATAVNVGPTSR